MKQLELSPRLLAIAEQVPQGAKLADIGTDHAYLPVWLLNHGRIDSAIASDLREGPLSRGRESARRNGVENQISFRCCSGLEAIRSEEADTIVIAGMGGELIAAILEQAPWTKDKKLLLQPMTSQAELRTWLEENGYCVELETAVAEGRKYYMILTVTGGSWKAGNRAERLAGKNCLAKKEGDRAELLSDLIARQQRVIRGMQRAESPDTERLNIENCLLDELKELEKEWETCQP